MRNGIISQLKGHVTVEITGTYPEQLLNRCVNQGLHVWDIKAADDNQFEFKVDLSDVAKMRHLFRGSGLKVTFKQRTGLPFLLKWLRVRSGFVAGAIFFIIGIILMSNMVWGYSINGASPQVEQKLHEAILDLGIERGAFLFQLPKPDQIQRHVTDRIDEATWIGVRQKGTTFEFEVVEQVRQTEPEIVSPRHLVASKKAVIRKMFVEDGTAIKRTNDVVEKGDLLVSGFIGAEGNEQTVPAKASVIGEIWYTSNVSMPLEQPHTSITGDQRNKYSISMGSLTLPFWNIKKPAYESYEVFEKETNLTLFGYRLPVQFMTSEHRETMTFTRSYTRQEAVEVLKKQARNDLQDVLSEEAEIVGEQILHEAYENDTVSLEMHYQVLEEITQEKPIIQGD